MKKLLFVYNPHSGKGQIGINLADIVNIFAAGGYDINIHPTQRKDDAYITVKERASEFDLIVTSGGDGTTNETIKGIMDGGHHTPVGLIPAGTMNDFATSLGIPKNMPDAARYIMKGMPEFVDVGAFNDRFFTYVAAFGVFTKVSYATDQNLKNQFGVMAYMIDAIREVVENIGQIPRHHLKIRCNGQVVEGDFLYGMVANSLSVGGIKNLAGNDISMNDNVFEGIFIKSPSNIAELNISLNALITKNFNSDSLYYFRSDNFVFESDGNVPWTTDGEYGGNDKIISICPMHNAVRVVVDKKSAPGLK